MTNLGPVVQWSLDIKDTLVSNLEPFVQWNLDIRDTPVSVLWNLEIRLISGKMRRTDEDVADCWYSVYFVNSHAYKVGTCYTNTGRDKHPETVWCCRLKV